MAASSASSASAVAFRTWAASSAALVGCEIVMLLGMAAIAAAMPASVSPVLPRFSAGVRLYGPDDTSDPARASSSMASVHAKSKP